MEWKTIAIIFIILFVIETVGVVWIFNLGYQAIEKESECAYNICEEQQTYNFDSVDNICYCFEDGEIVHEEYMK